MSGTNGGPDGETSLARRLEKIADDVNSTNNSAAATNTYAAILKNIDSFAKSGKYEFVINWASSLFVGLTDKNKLDILTLIINDGFITYQHEQPNKITISWKFPKHKVSKHKVSKRPSTYIPVM